MFCKLLLSLLAFEFLPRLYGVTDDYVHYPEVKVSYRFYKTSLKWGEARLKCISENATLAMPKNSMEAQIMKNIFESAPKSSISGSQYPDYFLLRFHDLYAENEYLTDDGHPIQYFFHTWAVGQPDNNENIEDCGSMHRSGYINDVPCNLPYAFMCEKRDPPYLVDPMRNIRLYLDPAYALEPHSKKRFKLHTNPKTWDQARSICYYEGGQLAVIESKQEEDFLVNMFNNPENKVKYAKDKNFAFLGFHDLFIDGDFVTATGRPLKSLQYVRWNGGQPNGGGNENCGALYYSGGLNDHPCSFASVFFCEIKPSKFINVKVEI